MGKGADVASKYAVGEHDPEAAKKVKAETTDDDDSAAKPETQNVPPRPSTAELQLVVDYSTAEEEKDIGDPHRSAVIIPGFAVSNADNGALCPRAIWLTQRSLRGCPQPAAPDKMNDDADDDYGQYDSDEDAKEVEKPELGYAGAVDPLKQRDYEQQCHRRAKRLNKQKMWKEAIEIARDGLDIDPNSKALDKDLTLAYLSWGNQELAAGKYGEAAIVFRQAIDDNPRDLEKKGDSELLKGLARANKGERDLRLPAYRDKPCAGCFCGFVGFTVLLAAIGALSPAPESVCETTQPCLNGAECTDNLLDGTHTCTCAPGWRGEDCSVLGDGEALAPPPPAEPESVPLTDGETQVLVSIMLICGGGAGVWGALWLRVVRKYPHKLVWITFGAVICAQCSLGALLLAGFGSPNGESNGFGIMFFLSAGFTVLLGFVLQTWVPFAVAMFRSATEVMDQHTSMIGVVYAATASTIGWLFICGIALTVTGVAGYGSVLVYFTYFWFAQTSKAVVHCSVAGTTANWYFVTHQMNPVAQATRRAVSTSLGSLAFGSLLVASLQFFRFIQMLIRSRRSAMSAVSTTSTRPGSIEYILATFNDYAYVQIAVYGSPYREAAKATASLMKQMGVAAILSNTVIISGVCVLGCVLGGVLGAALAWYLVLMNDGMEEVLGSDGVQGFSGLCFCLCYLMTLPYMEVLRAVATSVLVCFAQNPYVLKMNNPRLFQEIDDSFVVRTGRGFDEPEYDYEDYEEEGEDGEQEEGEEGEEEGRQDEQTRKMVRFEP